MMMSPLHAGNKVPLLRLYCIRQSPSMVLLRTMEFPKTEGRPLEKTARLRMLKKRQLSPMLVNGAAVRAPGRELPPTVAGGRVGESADVLVHKHDGDRTGRQRDGNGRGDLAEGLHLELVRVRGWWPVRRSSCHY